ncbi:MAG: hypothetical protein FJZ58_05035, partial [Chlamydiae bacterium]|nr:hypothetical protein [Chlamydiota bacterium]
MMILPFVFFFAMATPNERTLSSYELATQEYVQGTATEVSGSFKKWIDATLALLSEEAEIFEIGSGFGRDAKYMESYGFHVERSDATEAFIALMQTEGYAALYFNVITDTFPSTYDLIFANAVFLHLTP